MIEGQGPSIRVRIDHIDWTLTRPTPADDAPPHLTSVPVLRIYGPSSLGPKACLHVHQVYRYLYIDYTHALDPASVKQYLSTFERSLNHALAITLKQDPGSAASRYTRAILLVKGVPFYGFHYSYAPFLKIYLVDPDMVTRTVALLSSGAVMGTAFKAYEAHLSFVLQFLCDFGLYGCNWIDLGNTESRSRLPSCRSTTPNLGNPGTTKESPLDLEIDVVSSEILNRRSIVARPFHQSLDAGMGGISPSIQSLKELWDNERTRRIKLGLPPTPTPAVTFNGSGTVNGQWNSTELLWDRISERIDHENLSHPEFNDRSTEWSKWTMSTHESTGALWPLDHRTWEPRDETGRKLDLSLNPYHQDPHEDLIELPVEFDQTVLDTEDFDELIERHREVHEVHEETEGGLQSTEDDLDLFQIEDEPDPTQERNDIEKDIEDINFAEVLQELEPDLAESRRENESLAWLSLVDDRLQLYIQHGVLLPVVSRSALYVTGLQQDQEPSIQQTLQEPLTNALQKGCDQLGEPAERSPETEPGDFMHEHESSQQFDKLASTTPYFRKGDQPAGYPGSGLENGASRQKRKLLAGDLESSINLGRNLLYVYSPPPLLRKELYEDGGELLRDVKYRDPYYSRFKDIPLEPQEIGGLWYDLEDERCANKVPEWLGPGVEDYNSTDSESGEISKSTISDWEYITDVGPPNRKRVRRWLGTRALRKFVSSSKKKSKAKRSESGKAAKAEAGSNDKVGHKDVVVQKGGAGGVGVTQEGKGDQMKQQGIKSDDDQVDLSHSERRMSIMAMELITPAQLQCESRTAIISLAYSFQPETCLGATFHCITGVLALDPYPMRWLDKKGVLYEYLADELGLINRLSELILQYDPDILVGWDLKRGSWGHLASRAMTYGLDFSNAISRASSASGFRLPSSDEMTEGFTPTGRHVLNVWRVIRSEHSLTSYSFENVSFSILQQRYPYFDRTTLTHWCRSAQPRLLQRITMYLIDRTVGTLKILEKCETVTKLAEFARTCGVDFFSALIRGSQFKVESFMTRLSKPESFVLLSPSKSDVGCQNAAECMPLILEPRAGYYKSPVLVLDFQSLYPSMMIAYNYCYTTCIGRIQPYNDSSRLGVLGNLEQSPGLISKLKDHLIVAPNGILYTDSLIRKGLLSRMLTDLLNTRIMIKEAMKTAKQNNDLLRILDARQTSLKFVCNVTYGYTSASFSGRMPAVEIADSIVQSGRETLEKAIKFVQQREEWGAKVVYGDTDSLFVSLPGKSREDAFSIGKVIADSVTKLNPPPVRLKFEKVYLPCMLLAKKRYVGFKLETADQKLPTFDAKGIETVRRDGVPAQAKLTELVLRTLFREQDLSKIKSICFDCWGSVLDGSTSLKDYIFAKEVKLGSYSDKLNPPPGAAVALRLADQETGGEAHFGERVPFVIAQGARGELLSNRARSPKEFLADRHNVLDAHYYIQRVLMPPLQRVLGLVGVNVQGWYDSMRQQMESAKIDREEAASPHTLLLKRPVPCLSCGFEGSQVLCSNCQSKYVESAYTIRSRLRVTDKSFGEACLVCQSCCLIGPDCEIACTSLDCEWMFHRKTLENDRTKLFEALDILETSTEDKNSIDTL